MFGLFGTLSFWFVRFWVYLTLSFLSSLSLWLFDFLALDFVALVRRTLILYYIVFWEHITELRTIIIKPTNISPNMSLLH